MSGSVTNHPSYAASTSNKYVSLIRAIQYDALDKQCVKQVHEIVRPKRQVVQRRRRQLTDDEFLHMGDWTLAKYKGPGLSDYWKDVRKQFHHWMVKLFWIGIHVPTSTSENTAIC